MSVDKKQDDIKKDPIFFKVERDVRKYNINFQDIFWIGETLIQNTKCPPPPPPASSTKR